ncbi:uncharacterized protein I303_102155 [Kwoniella dejecticola CBS 10117]|uniref:Mitochondrial protein n=1 Tax=Kwoniella dejecticola CBS 10117 TaxID=1296121 RepID=A0A1A6ABT2_9TREE|nr:mitochondrial protein [Kwoniella dejecticola CBS 10117]OBR87498.1 mitochondrial protein [Kwoniella dejecticola CBS 10117]
MSFRTTFLPSLRGNLAGPSRQIIRSRPQLRISTKGYSTASHTHAHGHGHGRTHGHTHADSAPRQRTGPGAFRRWATRFALALAFPAVYVAGAAFPPQLVLFIFPRYAPPPPHKDSARGKSHISDMESCIHELDIVEEMRKKVGEGEWYETRPYQNYDPNKVHNSLTAGSLRGPGMLAIAPVLFAKTDESEAIAVIHLGRALCGHDGIIHGGLLATVFDETLARNALLNLPSNIGVTANLNINYRSPCMADQFVIVRTKLETIKGRKSVVSGYMETTSGERIADATGIFIEPKWAQFLASSGVTEAMGTRKIPDPSKSPMLLDDQTEHSI